MRALPLVVLAVLLPTGAHAAERVETLRSYWNADRSAILSDALVTREDGTREVRQILGGSVDGIGMIQIPLYRVPGKMAFVPTRSTGGNRLRWSGSCIHITPDRAGSNHIADDEEMTGLRESVRQWNDGAAGCSYMRFVLLPPQELEVGLDGKNTVKFRETRWCRPKRGDTPEKCYDEGATAITTLFFIDRESRPDDGTVLDADIEINAVDYAIAVGCETQCLTSSTRPIVEDLENTLAHELGHILGLDHTCWDGAPSNSPLDEDGQPAPACSASDLPDSVVDATMYNFQDPRETKKRSPESDDVDGVCTAYPLAGDPGFCEEVTIDTGNGCCAVAGGHSRDGRDGAAWLGGLLLAGGLVVRAVRARACSRTRRR